MNSHHCHERPRMLRATRKGKWDSEFKTSGTSKNFLEEVTCYLGFADQLGSLIHVAGGGMLVGSSV